VRSARRWWAIYGAAAVAVVAGLSWLSLVAARAEREEARRRVESAHLADVRVALWRLDAWLGGFVAREAARPPGDYLVPGAGSPAVERSPLEDFRSEHVIAHFRWSPESGLESPWSIAADEDGAAWRALRRALDDGSLLRTTAADPGPQASADDGELARRAAAGAACQAPEEAVATLVGPLVPAWLEDAGEPGLALVRRFGDEGGLQGLLVDWPGLSRALLAQVGDVLPGSRLEPWRGPDAPAGSHRLATLPATLEVEPPPAATASLGAVGWQLGLAWLAAVGALAAVGLTLRSSIDLARRRHRFATAIAHELRTPLTTFRLHTDLLANGMVAEEERESYLRTLSHESERLGEIVGNVLEHARLEASSGRRTAERLSFGALLERLVPPLERQVAAAGMRLDVRERGERDAELAVPVPVLSRIVGNLVDNATRHARGAADERVHLEAELGGSRLQLRVRDHGPGIPAEHARRVFEPFERGSRATGDGTPGLGLGLALSRELARHLGGDLVLRAPAEGGAELELSVPAALDGRAGGPPGASPAASG
jgi:signal transduction histidine kinase